MLYDIFHWNGILISQSSLVQQTHYVGLNGDVVWVEAFDITLLSWKQKQPSISTEIVIELTSESYSSMSHSGIGDFDLSWNCGWQLTFSPPKAMPPNSQALANHFHGRKLG